MSTKSNLIQLAAEMARRNNMPSTDYEDWDWPKGMQTTSWRKIYDAAEKADEQCRKWAITLRKIADDIKEEK